MAIIFKFFHPNGACRRVTFGSVPELASINELVDGMVEAPAERRRLTYVDSEGDHVVIKTSQDVVEAVRDAREAGAKTIKVLIRPRGRGRCGSASGSWPQGCGRGHRGLLAHPRKFSKELRELSDVLGAIFPGVFVKVEVAKESGASEEADHVAKTSEIDDAAKTSETDDAAKTSEAGDAAKSTPPPATASPAEADKNISQVTTLDAGPDDAKSTPPPATASPAEADKNVSQATTLDAGADDAKSTSPPATASPAEADKCVLQAATLESGDIAEEAKDAASDVKEKGVKEEAELDTKAALLRDMGFELPLDVARNMISEMGGRMDLIVRALVANAK